MPTVTAAGNAATTAVMVTKDTAVLWNFINGRWWRIDGARPAVTVNGKEKSAMSEASLFHSLPSRLAFARRHNPTAFMVVTSTSQPPRWQPGGLPGQVIVLG